MGYEEYYLSKKIISDKLGLGKNIWLLKVPRLSDHPSGHSLLGSLIEENSPFIGKHYPIPYHLTTPGLFLDKLKDLRDALGIPSSAALPKIDGLAKSSFVLNKSTGLDLDVTANLPGIPAKLSLGIDLSKIYQVRFSLNKGSMIKYIQTEYLCRLARHFKGNAQKVNTKLAVEVDDNLIVDMILIGKNYIVKYTFNSALDSFFSAQAQIANNTYKGTLKITKDDNFSFTVDVTSNVEYLLGFKTITWDDVWD